jgi:intermediate cleaving peptidase 55
VSRAQEVYTDLPNNLISRNVLSRYLAGQEPSRTGGISRVFRDAGKTVKPLRQMMNELRVIKSDAEIANMRKAGYHRRYASNIR